MMRKLHRVVEEDYGFVPDLSSTTRANALRVLGNTPHGFYFLSPFKMAFHDLTPGKSLAPATSIVMGLGQKFIPVPKFPTSRKKAMESFERLERSLDLKVFFADADDNTFSSKTKLYVRSNWRPPVSPTEINTRLHRFGTAFRRLFYRKKSRTNFTSFQARTYSRLRADDSTIFAQADKGLGPTAVKLHAQYIPDGLKHLKDSSTYLRLTEAQALEEDSQLREKIKDWLSSFESSLEKEHISFIEEKLKESKKNHLGIFTYFISFTRLL